MAVAWEEYFFFQFCQLWVVITLESIRVAELQNIFIYDTGCLDNNKFTPLFEAVVWNRRWLIRTEVFFSEVEYTPRIRFRCPKQSPKISHTDQKIDGAKVKKKYFIKLFSYLFSSYPCDRVPISQGITIIA